MKKSFNAVTCLALVFVLIFALCGCGNSSAPAPAPAPADNTPAPADAAAPAPAGPSIVSDKEKTEIQDDKTYNLSFSVAASAMPLMEEYVRFVSEKTDGHIAITLYDNNSFGSASDIMTMTQDGTLDLFYGGISQYAGAFNVGCACDIPFLYEDIQDVYNMQHALWDAGYLDEEMNNDTLRIAFLTCTDMQRIAFKERKVDSLADFSGLKIRNPSAYLTPIFEGLGATPTTIRVSEVYLSLETGVVDAAISSPESMCNYSLHEVCSYLMEKPFYGGTMVGMMNTESYNSLSDEMKALFDEANQEFMDYQLGYMQEMESTYLQTMNDGGCEVYEPSAEFAADLDAYRDSCIEAYTQKMNDLGYDGQAIMDCVMNAIGK